MHGGVSHLARSLAGLLVVALGAAGCASPPATKAVPGRVQHVVVCWLKDAGNAAQRETLIAASRQLAAIPDVRGLQVGAMLPSDRPIVDSSFDLALIVTFDDAAAMSRYLAHPLHTRLAREVLQPLTRQIRVYDFVE